MRICTVCRCAFGQACTLHHTRSPDPRGGSACGWRFAASPSVTRSQHAAVASLDLFAVYKMDLHLASCNVRDWLAWAHLWVPLYVYRH